MAEYLVAFGSTHAALSFEAAFGGDGRLVPVPPKVRAGCGMGLLFLSADSHQASARVRETAARLGVSDQIDGMYLKSGASYEKV